jgi:invasion protein IalB
MVTWMFRFGWAALALIALSLPLAPAQAQAPSAQQQTPPPENWASGCTASARGAALDCSIMQRAVQSRTGRLVAMVRIRIPPGSKSPVMLVQVPLGVYLPGKLTMSIDGTSIGAVEFQTCDQNGCYAGTPVSDSVLNALMKGQTLNLTVQNQQHQAETVPITLIGFAKAYGDIQ